MAFSLSPGVSVQEKDATNIVPAVATTGGAFAGTFQWGPVEQIFTLDSESQLVSVFKGPNNDTAVSFFTAANFLGYGNNLNVVRVVGTAAKNAVASGTAVLIKNRAVYDAQYIDGTGAVGVAAAKYPGAMGNSLGVSIADSATYSRTLTGNVTSTLGSATVTGVSTLFTTEAVIGSVLRTAAGVEIGTISAVSSATSIILTGNAKVAVTNAPVNSDWQYKNLFSAAPGTSSFAASVSGLNDEIHIVVIDTKGLFTGVPGSVLEKFSNASVASNAKKDDGSTNYYKNLLNNASKYVYWMAHPTGVANWGQQAQAITYTALTLPVDVKLTGGVSDDVLTDAIGIAGYSLFSNAEIVDIALVPTGGAGSAVQVYVINNIVEARKDCVAFISPKLASVLNNVGLEADTIRTERNMLPSSSYAVMDSGWKYQYDRYNDVYRWIPLNGDVAGLCARTDFTNDPWYSPAGFNRGQVKNVIKLAFSPNQTERDKLYMAGVNPVVSFQGQGTVLYGDKTLLAKPSAFDRINVRRLFIVLEKAIATASKYGLFEFNDPFTRAQFNSMVTPFLRDVQGRRGINDFLVVCDETVNTPEVIDGNRFVAKIFVKPARSINFIELQFIATPTGVEFSEIAGI